jgi:uncharacterized membrane protein (DUF106 family)
MNELILIGYIFLGIETILIATALTNVYMNYKNYKNMDKSKYIAYLESEIANYQKTIKEHIKEQMKETYRELNK